MKEIRVGIGEYGVSRNGDDVIKTYALGSCVAVIMYDKIKKIAGLIHIALPDSSVNSDKARNKPGYFVDTGLPLLLKEMKSSDAGRNHVWMKIVGGSNIMDTESRFNIGKRNVLAIKKYLWKNRLGIIAEDVGGNISRTVIVSVSTGEVIVSSKGKSWQL
jgi:chemotaxis protein CheD